MMLEDIYNTIKSCKEGLSLKYKQTNNKKL